MASFFAFWLGDATGKNGKADRGTLDWHRPANGKVRALNLPVQISELSGAEDGKVERFVNGKQAVPACFGQAPQLKEAKRDASLTIFAARLWLERRSIETSVRVRGSEMVAPLSL